LVCHIYRSPAAARLHDELARTAACFVVLPIGMPLAQTRDHRAARCRRCSRFQAQIPSIAPFPGTLQIEETPLPWRDLETKRAGPFGQTPIKEPWHETRMRFDRPAPVSQSSSPQRVLTPARSLRRFTLPGFLKPRIAQATRSRKREINVISRFRGSESKAWAALVLRGSVPR